MFSTRTWLKTSGWIRFWYHCLMGLEWQDCWTEVGVNDRPQISKAVTIAEFLILELYHLKYTC